ncbi:MAG: sigma-54-dependent Fis family transcriptional regulator [Planctomycetota bacterium]
MTRWSDFLARLRGDLPDRERQRWLLILELNRRLAAADSRAAVLTVLVDEAVRLFGAERGFLVVRSPKAPGFAVEVARSFEREAVANPERKLSTTILQQALERGEGRFSEDAQASDLAAAQSVADLRLRSVLCAPLRKGDEVLGALYLDHRFQAGAFTEADLSWLLAFADQGAIVLHLHDLLAANRAQAAQLAEQNRSLQATVQAQAEVLSAPPAPLRQDLRHPFASMVGTSPALLRALHVLDRVVDTELPVLLCGESGTGKEVAARALHQQGPRRRGEFVAVNVAAIADGTLESELFGHVRGAYTGADRDRIGLLRQAAGGTLFLDEVTEMDLDLQAKLLRALEDRTVRPLGADREFSLDVRVIAATNREPRQAIADGRLREDLYFRLAVVTVRLPPLRQRLDDVVPLAEAFLQQEARQRGGVAPAISPALAAALKARPWPGNVRQLRNELLRLLAMADGGELRAEALPPSEELPAPASGPTPAGFDLAAVERWAIERALSQARGNKAEAARLLGIGRRTLYDKLAGWQ